jgi:hypothetical protein
VIALFVVKGVFLVIFYIFFDTKRNTKIGEKKRKKKRTSNKKTAMTDSLKRIYEYGSDNDEETNANRKRARKVEETTQSRFTAWKEREDLRFRLAGNDNKALRRYLEPYLYETSAPGLISASGANKFILPVNGSREMTLLIADCRRWREQKWHQKQSETRRKRVERQQRQRRARKNTSPEQRSQEAAQISPSAETAGAPASPNTPTLRRHCETVPKTEAVEAARTIVENLAYPVSQ